MADILLPPGATPAMADATPQPRAPQQGPLKVHSFRPNIPLPEKTLDRPDGKERNLSPTHEDGFPPPEILKEQTDAMTRRLERLMKLSSEPNFDEMMASGIHFMDRELLNLLTTKTPDGHGGERYTGIDNDALNQFMNSTRGQEITYSVRMYDLMLATMGAAIRTTITPPSGPPTNVQNESIPVSGRGFLRGIYDKLQEFTSRPINETNGRPSENIADVNGNVGTLIRDVLAASGVGAMVGGGIGTSVAPGIGTLIGAGAGALLPPAFLGIMHAARAGERIEVTQCIQALQTLVGGDAEPPGVPKPARAGAIEQAQRRWLREFAGIDPEDLTVQQDNRGRQHVVFRPNHIAHTVYGGKELRDRLVGETQALRKVQEALGVPPQAAQSTDIDWILNGNNGPHELIRYNGPSNPGQRGLDLDRKTLDQYNPNRGGMLFFNPEAQQWQTLEVPDPNPHSPTGWMTNPYLEQIRTRPTLFNLGRMRERNIQWDMEGNARRYMDAYRTVLRQEIRQAADEIRNGGRNFVAELRQGITDQITARGENGPTRQQRIHEAQERRDLYQNLGQRTGQEGWTTYENAVRQLNTTRNELTHLQDELHQDVANPLGTAVGAVRAGMTPEEAALSVVLTDPTLHGASIELNGETIESIRAQEVDVATTINNDLNTYRNNLLGGRATPTADEARQIAEYKATTLEETRQELLAPILAQKQLIQERLRTLREARQAVSDQTRALREGETLVRNGQGVIAQNETAFTRITTAPAVGPNPQITQADLVNSTYVELQQRVNALGIWPAGENGIETNQQILLRAMTEAQARATLPARTPEYTAAIDPAVWALSENQLATLDANRLHTIMTARHGVLGGGAPAVPAVADIQTLKDEALQQIRIRGEAVTNLQQELTRQQNIADAQTNAAENPMELRPLQLMQRAVDNIGNIDSRLLSMQATNSNTADLRQLTETTYILATPGGEYVQEETNHNTAYLRWLNLIFNYQNANDLGGRGTAFQAATQLLPPQALANLIQRGFLQPPNAAGRAFDDVLLDLQGHIDTGAISTYDIRRFIQQDVILEYLGNRVTTH